MSFQSAKARLLLRCISDHAEMLLNKQQQQHQVHILQLEPLSVMLPHAMLAIAWLKPAAVHVCVGECISGSSVTASCRG